MKTILLVTLACLVGAQANADIYHPKAQPQVKSPLTGAAFAGFSCELTEYGQKTQITGIKADSKIIPKNLEGLINPGEVLVQYGSENIVYKIDVLKISKPGFGGQSFRVEASSPANQKLSIQATIGSSVGNNGRFQLLQDTTVARSGPIACRFIKNSELANQK